MPTTGDTNNYIYVDSNSYFWKDLNMLLNYMDSIDGLTNKPMMCEINLSLNDRIHYLIVGLKNTKKNGYEMNNIKNLNFTIEKYHIFTSIESIIDYLISIILMAQYDDFKRIIQYTIDAGYNLNKTNNKMERENVYKRIDQERDYQDIKWKNNDVPDDEKSIAEWLNYIEFHLGKAKNEIYYLKHQEALAEVRKIAALAVKCMEIHGCSERNVDNCCQSSKKSKKDGCCDGECDCHK